VISVPFTINIAKLAYGPGTLTRSGEISIASWLAGRSDVRATNPLQVKLTARGSADGLTVDCDCSVDLEYGCAKCLRRFREPLRYSFQERFTNKPESADEEAEIHLVRGDTVDLLPYVEENLQLALPFVAVCSSDCRGLCPVCGGNRNERDCGCREENIDPRLAGLKDFFKDEESR
jgi:uncharacterized protein